MISVITDTSFSKMSEVKCHYCVKSARYSKACREISKPNSIQWINLQVKNMNIEKQANECEQANENEREMNDNSITISAQSGKQITFSNIINENKRSGSYEVSHANVK